MAAGGGAVSMFSVVEDVLQQQCSAPVGDLDLVEFRKVEQAASRRNEAAGWLRKMIGVVAAKDLPAEPTEEEFRLGLRSGIILCNAINKVQTGVVPKVVECPSDSASTPDGALKAFQYFENLRNFRVAIEEMGLPTFEASDLEQGGKSARIVSTVLALKSYSEWKQTGGNGTWKFGGNVKPTTSVKSFVRKNSEPFMNSLSRTSSMNEKSLNSFTTDLDSNKMQTSSGSLSMLVRAVLSDKKPEDVPMLVESVLNKVMEQFEKRLSGQYELTNTSSKDATGSHGNRPPMKFASGDKRIPENLKVLKKEESFNKSYISDEEMKSQLLKQQMIFDQQQRDVQELKHTLHITKSGIQFMKMKFHEEFQNIGLHIHGLAHAASGYHKVLEENRKLYNQVQDLKGSIRVYCRVRPFLSGQSNNLSCVDHMEDGNITVNTPSRHGNQQRIFSFNKVFGPSSTQADVFSDMQPLIRSVLDGYNVCIFAYGQTGSGKTFTMTGPRELTEKSQGVNYRALGDLFLIADQRKDTFHYDVSVQMIEIYNEQVRDLLVTDGANKRLEIRNSSQTGYSVPDANITRVSSTSDVIDLMNLGHKNRVVGATALNDRSSRSHSCLTVHVQGRDLTTGSILRGCMHLVDLAGSERVDKSEVTGDRLKEAQHINRSLSALGDVIASLAQKNPHVPYRNSKLTQLLQDSLGGQAKTLMFVHISPEPDAIDETISTLKFAERVATVELGAARVNKDGADVKALKEQIAGLRAALARKEEEAEQRPVLGSSDNYKMKAGELLPLPLNYQGTDIMGEQFGCRQPMGNLGNIELQNNSAPRQKRQNFEVDELLANSPPWPPVKSPGQNHGDEEKDMGSGDWVDKVMVNKQEVRRSGNPLGGWEADNENLSDTFYQKYLQDSSNKYPEQSYNMFTASNGFNVASNDDMDDLDAATSDSSEPDLLWKFNQTKLISAGNGIGSRIKKTNAKPVKSPELSKHSLGPSPSRKPLNGLPHRTARQLAPTAEMKRKAAHRK
ncbi:kinesin-like protein KIN-14I [Argentina anserina]|uniref:kinesin-like protein KIN-14I n=1 Tax=Argentina anserina TaxID=57926 RepID=UPI0021766F8F|nr:kinesin-like protein KIN-14I [Potentilla anserina]